MQAEEQARTGLSMDSKLAIGAGAAVLFGCHKLGCFNQSATQPGNSAAGRSNQFR